MPYPPYPLRLARIVCGTDAGPAQDVPRDERCVWPLALRARAAAQTCGCSAAWCRRAAGSDTLPTHVRFLCKQPCSPPPRSTASTAAAAATRRLVAARRRPSHTPSPPPPPTVPLRRPAQARVLGAKLHGTDGLAECCRRVRAEPRPAHPRVLQGTGRQGVQRGRRLHARVSLIPRRACVCCAMPSARASVPGPARAHSGTKGIAHSGTPWHVRVRLSVCARAPGEAWLHSLDCTLPRHTGTSTLPRHSAVAGTRSRSCLCGAGAGAGDGAGARRCPRVHVPLS